MNVLPAALSDLAPRGHVRAAINYGNPVLASPHPITGEPDGVSVDLAHALGRRLGLPVELLTFDSAGKVFEASKVDGWDVAFLAVDPVRATHIAFTAPYVVIEGTYIVREASPLHSISDFDRPQQRIAVGQGAAYDLFLSRTLTKATLVRADTSAGAVDLFVRDGLDAAAGVRQPLMAYAAQHPGFRVVAGSFSAIEQAMGTPVGRDAGRDALAAFIEDMKRTGFVADALARHHQHSAAVAPAAPA